MKNKRIVIPGIFTTLNLFCGFLAILKIGDDKILYACWLIIFAAVFDLLDGQIARLTKSSSDFGVEFDSIADVVSFGVAPSILLYHVYFYQFGILGMLISFFPLVAGGFRLARYNIQVTGVKKSNFSGLPIPVMATSFASFILFNFRFWDELFLTRFMVPQVVLVCVLMVSSVEYYTLPKLTFKLGKKHSSFVVFVILIMLTVCVFPQETFYIVCLFYIAVGIFRFLFKIRKMNDDDIEPIKKRKNVEKK